MNIIEETIYSPQLDKIKKIRIYLPKNYNKINLRFPVLYMHDGQNIFKNSNEHSFGSNWNIDEILEKFGQQCIIVGIDNSQEKYERYNEYSPWKNSIDPNLSNFLNIPEHIGGKGVEYGLFIVKTLKSYIDLNYKTFSDFENTYIAGSSMGAIISLYIALNFPHIFSKIGLFSIATWFCEENLVNFIKNKEIPQNMKFYMDMGTKESSCNSFKEFSKIYINGFLKIKNTILEKNIPNDNFFSILEPGGLHNEEAWNRRFPLFYHFIMLP